MVIFGYPPSKDLNDGASKPSIAPFKKVMDKMKHVVFDIETTGLTPLRDRVVSIGLKRHDDERILITQNDELKELNKQLYEKEERLKQLLMSEEEGKTKKIKGIREEIEQLKIKIKPIEDKVEKQTIQEFWDYVKEHKSKYGDICLIGYNSVSFDMHFLKIRSTYHNIPVFPFKKYEEHIDLFYILTPYRGKYAKLDDYCNLFGIPAEFKEMGDAVPKAWKKGDYELIIAHNLDDIRRTWKLYHVLKEHNMIDTEIDMRI